MARRILHDEFFKKAKDEGYLARSAYKLQEIAQRHRLIPRGGRILDLGCAPGAWLQIASELTGPAGAVVGIDLKDIRDRIAPNVRAIVADAYEIAPDVLLDLAGGMFDAVLSDMAPDTTGAGDTDHHRSVRLCRRVLELLPPLLRRGGGLAMKVFEGAAYPALLKETAGLFDSAKGFKPKASRDISREIYIVATGYRGPRPPRSAPPPPRPPSSDSPA